MTLSLSLQQNSILMLWITTILYGIYIVIFAAAVYILVFRNRYSAINRNLLLITIILFAISTAQDILAFLHAFLTTGILADGSYPGETESVLREKDVLNLLISIVDALMVTNSLIADALLIWRCFMVWGRRLSVIIVPVVMLISGTVLGVLFLVLDVKLYLSRLRAPLSEPTPLPGWKHIQRTYTDMNIAFYVTSFVTNVLMSLLIAGRIWWVTREARRCLGASHGRKYAYVACLIIESGAVYSLCLLFAAAWARPKEGSDWSIYNCIISQVVSISPTLIIVLVAAGKTSETTSLALETMQYKKSLVPNPIESTQSDAETETHIANWKIEVLMEDVERGYAQKPSATGDTTVPPA